MLRRWDELLQLTDAHHELELPPPVLETGTALRPAAAEDAIETLERRLGVQLPPSYRLFLALSNGSFAQPAMGFVGNPLRTSHPRDQYALGLLDAPSVGWFREREPEYVDIWGYIVPVGVTSIHPMFERRVPECEYLDHARGNEPESSKNGHLRYALQIAGNVNGNTILLNPLVVDRDGEWEAWDFGSQILGANRHRSFASLLAADIERLEDELSRPSWRLALQEQVAPEPAAELARTLVDMSVDTSRRQAAANALGESLDPIALDALVTAAADPEPRIQASVLRQLASREEPEARRAAVAILTDPEVEDWVTRAVPYGCKDVVWEAWSATRDPRLVVALANSFDERAVDLIVEAVLDPATPWEVRDSLVSYGYWWQKHDPAVLVAAAELPDAPLMSIGGALARLDAREEAALVLARSLETEFWRSAAEQLGRIGTDSAFVALLAAFREEPRFEVALALGSYDDERASEALLAAAPAHPELMVAFVDALEKMPRAHAADALAALAGGGLLAARALARRRDERALEPLLGALGSDDPELAFEGADGLRDLRSVAAAPALLAVVEAGGDDDLVVCAAHAFVSMRAPEAITAVELLARGDRPSLRRLAEVWL